MKIKILVCQIFGPTATGSAGPVPTPVIFFFGGGAALRPFDKLLWTLVTTRHCVCHASDGHCRFVQQADVRGELVKQ